MKLPINALAKLFLRIGVSAVGKAVADPNVKLTKEEAKAALSAAVQAEVLRQVEKRAGLSV